MSTKIDPIVDITTFPIILAMTSCCLTSITLIVYGDFLNANSAKKRMTRMFF